MGLCFGTKNIEKLYIGSKEVEGISVGDEPAWTPGGGSQWLCFTALENGCELGFWFYDSWDTSSKLWYSRDKKTWTEYTKTGSYDDCEKLSLDRYEKVYFKGTAQTKFYYPRFSGSGSMAVSGNPMTMLDEDGTLTDNWTHFPVGPQCEEFNLKSMFQEMTALVYAHGLTLSATTLTEACYQYMFANCSSLESAPKKLPAMTLTMQCYQGMFANCTSLLNAPQLPATTTEYQCYKEMFSGCTALATPPTELPALTLAESCYHNMFYNCRSLALAPTIAATVAAESSCERMFQRCTSLVKLPGLKVTELADGCFSCMFAECEALKLSETDTEEYSNEYRIPVSGTATGSDYATEDMFAATGGTFADTPGVNTTYYTANEVV